MRRTRGPQNRHARGQNRTGRWLDQTLQRALAAVKVGGKIKTVARYYNIPPSSLSDHLYGRILTRKKGPPTILTAVEESALTAYMSKMQDFGHPLSIQQLRMKVAMITQERVTPFKDGLPGGGCIRWFRKRHSDLSMRNSQGLEFARARRLCHKNMESFYANLAEVYQRYKYPPDHIWNSDESGAHRNGGGRVWAKRGSINVQSLMPNEREWITMLSCINAVGQSIPGFYIFKGKRMREDYIAQCEDEVSMAMQPEAWMTSILFSHWISHFIKALESRRGISLENRHLMIVDGHNSHVILEVV
jgi:hypothetical protein